MATNTLIQARQQVAEVLALVRAVEALVEQAPAGPLAPDVRAQVDQLLLGVVDRANAAQLTLATPPSPVTH